MSFPPWDAIRKGTESSANFLSNISPAANFGHILGQDGRQPDQKAKERSFKESTEGAGSKIGREPKEGIIRQGSHMFSACLAINARHGPPPLLTLVFD